MKIVRTFTYTYLRRFHSKTVQIENGIFSSVYINFFCCMCRNEGMIHSASRCTRGWMRCWLGTTTRTVSSSMIKKKSRHGFGARAAWRVRINIGADEAAGMCNQTLPPPHRTEWAAKSLKLNPTKAWAVLSSNEEESMAHIGMRADCSGGQRQKKIY
jgi:hypothetical protein